MKLAFSLVLITGAAGCTSSSSGTSSAATGTAAATTPAAGASSSPKVKHPADRRADEVLRIIARDYARATRVQRADSKWGACHDKTPGFSAALKCLEDVVATMEAEALRVPPPDATEECAKEIEQESHGYTRAALAYHRDALSWLRQNRARLEPVMASRSLFEACDLVSCAGYPVPMVGKHEGSEFYRVGKIKCTDRVFECAPPRGNVCWLTKVGGRLGLSTDKRGPVTVKGGSGRIVSLPTVDEPKGVTIDPKNL